MGRFPSTYPSPDIPWCREGKNNATVYCKFEKYNVLTLISKPTLGFRNIMSPLYYQYKVTQTTDLRSMPYFHLVIIIMVLHPFWVFQRTSVCITPSHICGDLQGVGSLEMHIVLQMRKLQLTEEKYTRSYIPKLANYKCSPFQHQEIPVMFPYAVTWLVGSLYCQRVRRWPRAPPPGWNTWGSSSAQRGGDCWPALGYLSSDVGAPSE